MDITYLFDPLCGWCYGAGPAIRRLAKRNDVTIRLAPTGLFAGQNARPLDAAFAAYAWQNDQRIEQLTGQSFSERYRARILEPGEGIFDSEAATLGVVAAGLHDAGGELAALEALQAARYVEGRDTSRLPVVAEVLSQAGLSEAANMLGSDLRRVQDAGRERIEAARADMAAFHAQGVPTLIVGEGDSRRMLRSDALFGTSGALERQAGLAPAPSGDVH